MQTGRLLPWLIVLLVACREGTETAGDPVVDERTQASPAAAAVMGEIIATNVSWGDLYSRGNAEQVALFYTEDAVLMTPQGDLTGVAAIADHFRALFATRGDTILATTTVTEALDVAGDRAYETGTVTRTLRTRTDSGTPAREVHVRYATFWERSTDGRWRIRRSLRAP
ncbi:MAG: DUF4440 domain-containing protein [Gemmatimonadales bacterium]|nr:MAG: DUF4440 domain-containing protein [Gemmatimonadales bacterium]